MHYSNGSQVSEPDLGHRSPRPRCSQRPSWSYGRASARQPGVVRTVATWRAHVQFTDFQLLRKRVHCSSRRKHRAVSWIWPVGYWFQTLPMLILPERPQKVLERGQRQASGSAAEATSCELPKDFPYIHSLFPEQHLLCAVNWLLFISCAFTFQVSSNYILKCRHSIRL